MGGGLLAAAALGLLAAGAGSLVCAALDERASWLERLATRLAVGLIALPLLPLALYELARVPLHPATAVALGVAGLPLLYRHLRDAPRGPEPPAHRLILVLLALGTFWVAFKGALAFPSFEGRDGWGHALGARYLLEVGVPRQPFPDWPIVHYVDAYPPLFDALLSIAASLGGGINGPLKAVSALLAGLVLLVFHGFALRVLRSPRRAAVATALWVVLPANLTRHVWAHSLALVLTFVALAAAARLRESPRFLAPGLVATGGVLLAAPTAGIKAGLLLGLAALAAWRSSRPWGQRILAQGALGLVVAAVWYGPAAARHGALLRDAMQSPAARRSALRTAPTPLVRPTVEAIESDTGGRAPEARRYSLDDFLFFRPYAFFGLVTERKFTEDIAPIGLGLVTGLSALLFLLRGRASPGRRLLRLWLAALLVLVLGPHLGFDFYTWRVWMLLAPVACLVAADVLCGLARGRGFAIALGLAAIALVNAAAALWFDHSRDVATRAFWSHGAAPGPESPWFFLRGAPLFAGVALLAAALAVGALGRRGVRTAAVAAILVAHVLIAAPIRLRVLTRFIEPLGYAGTLEYHGYLALFDHTLPRDQVLPLSGAERAPFVIGLDRRCAPWRRDEQAFWKELTAPGGAPDLAGWMRAHGYRYALADPTFSDQLREAGVDADARLESLRAAPGLEPVFDRRDGPYAVTLLRLRGR